jgi:hypothetical protein
MARKRVVLSPEEQEENRERELIARLLHKKAIAHILVESDDPEALVNGFVKAINKLGGAVIEDPFTEGTDAFGFVVYRSPKDVPVLPKRREWD